MHACVHCMCLRIPLEEGEQFLPHHRVDSLPHLGVAEPSLRLPFELGLWHLAASKTMLPECMYGLCSEHPSDLDADDGSQPFPNELAGYARIFHFTRLVRHG